MHLEYMVRSGNNLQGFELSGFNLQNAELSWADFEKC